MRLKKILALVLMGVMLTVFTASCRGPAPHKLPLLPKKLPALPKPPLP